MGCCLEYLYTGEYFPKKLVGQRSLEADPTVPSVDDTGEQLLKHARVYTLADKLGLGGLRTLASSKIHCVDSTARGEITYARYVYAYTSTDDTTVRAPVASFWATRSHTLRSEAEIEFKALCLEYPQFGYDVLSECVECVVRVMLMSGSPRAGRQAQEGAHGQDAPRDRQREETSAPQLGRAGLPCTGRIGLGVGFVYLGILYSVWQLGLYTRVGRASCDELGGTEQTSCDAPCWRVP